jgi:uncharacterized caspase-like protein
MPEIREVPDKGARRVAVVIGNSDYVNVPRLKNPAHDAQAVGRLFESMGFETWLGLNLSLAELRELLRTVTRSAPDADLLAFYYAGHAVQIDGSNYLLPADAQIESETDVEMESISLNLILDLFEATAGARLIFLDACRNDPFSGRTSEPSATRGFVAEKGLAQVKARAAHS